MGAMKPKLTNPYVSGMGVTDASMFVGRRNELRRAVDHLAGPTPSCVAFVGPTRVGKTSLMQRTQAELQKEFAGRQKGSGGVRCAWMTIIRISDQKLLCRPLVAALRRNFPDIPEPDAHASTSEGFLDWIDQWIGTVRTVLFLDDLDSIEASDDVRFEFYSVLRAATCGRPLALCVTSRHPLEGLCEVAGREESLLWNIFTTIDLGLLGLDEVKSLIYEPHAKAGMNVQPREWELILAEAGLLAGLVQKAGRHLFEAKMLHGGDLRGKKLFHLTETIRKDLSRFFPLFLRYAKEREPWVPEVARRLAAGEDISDNEEDLLEKLALAYRTAKGPTLMSEAFRQYLLSESEEETGSSAGAVNSTQCEGNVPEVPVEGGGRSSARAMTGKRFKIEKGFEQVVDLRTNETHAVNGLNARLTLQVMHEQGIDREHKRSWELICKEINKKREELGKPRLVSQGLVHFFKIKAPKGRGKITHPLYGKLIRVDGHDGLYWLEL